MLLLLLCYNSYNNSRSVVLGAAVHGIGIVVSVIQQTVGVDGLAVLE